jgi:hypothetical protein
VATSLLHVSTCLLLPQCRRARDGETAMLFVDDILVWETAIVSTNSAVYGTASLCGSTVADMIIPVTITVGACLILLVRMCRRSARLLQTFNSHQRHARSLPPLLLPCAGASHRDLGQTSVHQHARPGTLHAATVHACHTRALLYNPHDRPDLTAKRAHLLLCFPTPGGHR